MLSPNPVSIFRVIFDPLHPRVTSRKSKNQHTNPKHEDLPDEAHTSITYKDHTPDIPAPPEQQSNNIHPTHPTSPSLNQIDLTDPVSLYPTDSPSPKNQGDLDLAPHISTTDLSTDLTNTNLMEIMIPTLIVTVGSDIINSDTPITDPSPDHLSSSSNSMGTEFEPMIIDQCCESINLNSSSELVIELGIK